MANFEKAVESLLTLEGGYVDNPNDKGGPTNFGISSRWLKRAGLDRVYPDVKELTRDKAIKLYEDYFWKPYAFAHWGENDHQSIAERVFHATVNAGPGQAMKCFQRALRACGQSFVVDDGVYGPITMRGMTDAMSTPGAAGILAATASELAGYYRGLVAADPSQEGFLEGWLKRAYGE